MARRPRPHLEHLTISTLLDALTGFAPGVPAIVDDHGALPPEALRALAVRELRWLQGSGARRVGLLADNGRGWAITDLALVAGALPSVPLPHHFSAGQLAHALGSASVDAVLTDTPARILELGLGFAASASSPQTGLQLLARRLPDGAVAPLPAGTVKVTYTSGSTAEPKGVCLSAAALEAVANSVSLVGGRLGVGRHLALLPLSTLLENVAGLYAAWLTGATCHLPSAVPAAIARGSLAPAAMLAAIGDAAAESLILVPELLRVLVAGVESGWRAPGTARFYAVGGARVSGELLGRSMLAGLPVFEGYGLSECASVVCLNAPGATRAGSVGRPLPHARVRIDEHGEIHAAGALLAGYVGEAPGAARADFATGDLGERDADGYVYVRGRLKNVFISSLGRNVSPEWIESELAQEPAIGQAVAFGEARREVVAVIAPARPGLPAGAIAAAVARANARLPRYAQVSRYHVLAEPLTVANGLLTGNGRPRRERILERYAPVIERLQTEPDHVAV